MVKVLCTLASMKSNYQRSSSPFKESCLQKPRSLKFMFPSTNLFSPTVFFTFPFEINPTRWFSTQPTLSSNQLRRPLRRPHHLERGPPRRAAGDCSLPRRSDDAHAAPRGLYPGTTLGYGCLGWQNGGRGPFFCFRLFFFGVLVGVFGLFDRSLCFV